MLPFPFQPYYFITFLSKHVYKTRLFSLIPLSNLC